MRHPDQAVASKFFRRIVWFVLPVIILFTATEVISYRVRELWPVGWVIASQAEAEGDSLYGRGVLDQEIARYKYEQILRRRPEILILGSSRMMQWRSELFDAPEEVYNAGGLLHNLDDLSGLLEHWPDGYRPRLVILGIDAHWFNSAYRSASVWSGDLATHDSAWSPVSHLYADRRVIFTLIKNVFKSPQILSDYWSRIDNFSHQPAYGFQALQGNGFREDGSYQYGGYLQAIRSVGRVDYQDREDPPIIERVRRGLGQFAGGGQFDDSRKTDLNKILIQFAEKNVRVIGVALPFSSEVYGELTGAAGMAGVFKRFQPEMAKLFTAAGRPFFDFSDLRSIGLDDRFMFDGFHPSEVVAAKMLLTIWQGVTSREVPNRLSAIKKLQNLINSPGVAPTELFGGDFWLKSKVVVQ